VTRSVLKPLDLPSSSRLLRGLGDWVKSFCLSELLAFFLTTFFAASLAHPTPPLFPGRPSSELTSPAEGAFFFFGFFFLLSFFFFFVKSAPAICSSLPGRALA